jgi:peptidoglycan/xylan/chitin deacetylase (PgdA/CDA1 family)
MKKFTVLTTVLFILAACQTPKNRDIASVEVPDAATEKLVDGVIIGDVISRQTLMAEVRTQIMTLAWTQQLQASVDLYLDTNKKPELQESELTCKLWDSYYAHHEAEDRLRDVQDLLLKKRNQAAYDWYLSIFRSTKSDTPAQIMAKAQIARLLQSEHQEACKDSTCLEFSKFPGKPKAAFDPFNDQEMLTFKNAFANKISIYTAASLKAMPKGDCFADSDRIPASDENNYDWKARNKTGFNLKPGEYIFTYDDGPHATYTMQLVDAWAKSGMAKPAFFWLGMNAKRYPKVVQQVRDQGFEIGVHTYSHADMRSLANATDKASVGKTNRSLFKKELESVSDKDFAEWRENMLDFQIYGAFDVIAKEVGDPSRVTKFRLPYGAGVRNDKIGKRLAKINVDHYFWAIDTLDWSDRNPLSLVDRIHKLMATTKRGIILFHDIHPQGVEASKILIQEFKAGKHGKVLDINDKAL